MSIEKNVALLRKFVVNEYEPPRSALTGALDAAGAVISDPTIDRNGVIAPTNFIFVRVRDRETAVFNRRVRTDISNVPVKIAYHRQHQRDEVVGTNDIDADFAFGTALTWVSSPTVTGGLDRSIVDARRLGPGRIYEDKHTLLNILALPFLYTDTDGNEKDWSSSAGVSLTGSVPAANTHILVRVALNPDPDSPVLVATAGTAKDDMKPFDLPAEALDITIDSSYISLGVVRLMNGDDSRTERIPDDGTDRFTDLRHLAADSPRSVNILNTRPEPVTGTKIIASGQSALWGSPVTVTGSFTISGQLKVA